MRNSLKWKCNMNIKSLITTKQYERTIALAKYFKQKSYKQYLIFTRIALCAAFARKYYSYGYITYDEFLSYVKKCTNKKCDVLDLFGLYERMRVDTDVYRVKARTIAQGTQREFEIELLTTINNY